MAILIYVVFNIKGDIMYVASYVDLSNFKIVNPLNIPLYVCIPCVTRVYKSKQDYINNEKVSVGFCITNVECLVSALKGLRYPDSPLTTPYTTHLAEMDMDMEFRVEGNMEPLKQRVRACHKRYLRFFEQLADRADEMQAVAETFQNVRNVMQRLNAT